MQQHNHKRNNPSSVKVTERKSYFSRTSGEKEGKKSSGNFQVILERKKKSLKRDTFLPHLPIDVTLNMHSYYITVINDW